MTSAKWWMQNFVQEDQHKAALEKEMLARIKAEQDFEEKSKQLQAAVENNSCREQQLAELQLLTKKVGCQTCLVNFSLNSPLTANAYIFYCLKNILLIKNSISVCDW